jgi:SPP1 family predicted phage head-tail adaptor
MSVAQTLDKRVLLQRPATGRDSHGQPLTGWQDVGTVWANVKDLTGRQYIAASATQNSVQATITIRYQSGIVPAMRAVHGDVVYDIESVLGQDNRMLQLMVKRGVSNG